MNHNFKDLTGQTFERLKVRELSPVRSKQGRIQWICDCKCGNVVIAQSGSLTTRNTKSCGCLNIEKSSARFKTNNPVIKLASGESAFKAVYRWYKRDAGKRGYEFILTLDEARKLMESNCFYCGQEPSMESGLKRDNGTFTRNGIDRKDNSKGYTIDNVVSCCFICNKGKWTQSVGEFKTWLTRVNNHMNVIPQVTPSLARWIITQ